MKQKKETRTTEERPQDVKRQWYLFDASGKTLGRFAAEIAKILRGKHKTTFTPNVDMGDGVVIVNADKIVVSGNKEAQKLYRYYTGHIGGLREVPYRTMQERKPDYIIRRAVAGMMPKSRLGKQQLRKLRIFKGEEHDLTSQKPIAVEV
ncbi:MAG: 50S ribosomal protein L13 [Chlamydiales bacterium]|nr:50S ribosomal protein L13 [Chlamydiales bacterium]MCH9636154.1 50S ribosomal protein L13 [Chlamydiales bacterium]